MTSFLQSSLRVGRAAILAVMCATGVAEAGPVADFETALRTAYADYRGALFQTNAKKQAESAQALASFAAKWQALGNAAKAAPPPHYADDPTLAETLGAVTKIVAVASEEIAGGKLAEAHETLEAIRDQIGDLRARNGVIGFSDRMNAYHAKMEAMLGADYQGFDAAGLGRLREDAAVLEYLAAEIVAHPAPEAKDAAYSGLVGAMAASVEALVKAVRSGDPAAVKAAVDGLKVPYSKLFLKFG